MTTYQDKVKALRAHHEELLTRKNEPVEWGNGIYEKYKNPILTAEHTPLEGATTSTRRTIHTSCSVS